jgi:NAD(P)-dependent dehydrogenase (short-subunit alcohol dehydrogenase family)
LIDTPIFDQQAPTKEGADQVRAQFAAAVPFGRLGRSEEIASTALFLASDESKLHRRRGPPSRWRHNRDLRLAARARWYA